jgi:hypothetical protein
MKCNKLFVASLSLALSLSASAVLSAQQQLRGIAPSSSVLLEVEDSSSASGSWDSRDSISQDGLGLGDELELWSSGSGGAKVKGKNDYVILPEYLENHFDLSEEDQRLLSILSLL